jgi:drug/metabolite transporter (DMT)-like permease
MGERVSHRQWLAVLVGLLGVGVLMQPWALAAQGPGVLPGYLMLLGASFA